MNSHPRHQRGVALLTVLLLVVVITVLVTALLDDIRFGIRRADNALALDRARWQAVSAERLAGQRIAQVLAADAQVTTLHGDWHGAPFSLPTGQGYVQAQLRDGTHCFNLNSVVQGANDLVTASERGARQYLALLRTLDIAEGQALQLRDSLTDWIDSDQLPAPHGAEDTFYLRGRDGYRTSGQLLADVSELRAIRGYDAAIYAQLRPFVCTLPDVHPAPINVNTLAPEQAPLLAMLTDGAITTAQARTVLAGRPAQGWRSAAEFWAQPQLASVAPATAAQAGVAVSTRYFRLLAQVREGRAQLAMESWFDAASPEHVRRLSRHWGGEQ